MVRPVCCFPEAIAFVPTRLSPSQGHSFIMSLSRTPLTGRMHFLARDPKYLHEKPYTLRYAPGPEDGFPQSNIDRVQHDILLHDLRPELELLEYGRCGFMLANCPSAMRYDDYDDISRIEAVHAAEVTDVVRHALGAESADLLDWVVRPHSFPVRSRAVR